MLKQHLQLKLSQKLSPQQIQLMKLIQLPTQAFEEHIKQEIEENPALETGKEESEDLFEIETNDDFESAEEDQSEAGEYHIQRLHQNHLDMVYLRQ